MNPLPATILKFWSQLLTWEVRTCEFIQCNSLAPDAVGVFYMLRASKRSLAISYNARIYRLFHRYTISCMAFHPSEYLSFLTFFLMKQVG